jgi:cation:H+ antiporter
MDIAFDVVTILVCIIGLWKGAEWVVESATRVARRLGLSDIIIGLTVVAIGTSAPEFAVTAVAAVSGESDISVGNVVGSNIFNLGFILGGLALFRAIKTDRKLVLRDGLILIASTVLLAIFLFDLQIARWEGIVLMTLLAIYVTYLILQREESHEELAAGNFRPWDVPILLGGLVIIVAAGHFFVHAATDLARLVGLSEWVIGVTIVAFGTSAPEIATSLIALLRGRGGMSVGNLIGSDLFNLLGVLGLAAVLQPMEVAASAWGSILLLTGMVTLVVIMMRTGWRLSRFEGAILVSIAMLRWVLDFTGR